MFAHAIISGLNEHASRGEWPLSYRRIVGFFPLIRLRYESLEAITIILNKMLWSFFIVERRAIEVTLWGHATSGWIKLDIFWLPDWEAASDNRVTAGHLPHFWTLHERWRFCLIGLWYRAQLINFSNSLVLMLEDRNSPLVHLVFLCLSFLKLIVDLSLLKNLVDLRLIQHFLRIFQCCWCFLNTLAHS